MQKVNFSITSQLFELLKLNFLKNCNCIMYFQDHRTQLWYHLVNIMEICINTKTHLIPYKIHMYVAIGILVKCCKFQGNQMNSFCVATP